MTSQETAKTALTTVKTTLVQPMRVTAGSPRWQTNGQTAEDLADLHKKEISGEASVATMVWWLWSWAVTTEVVVRSRA